MCTIKSGRVDEITAVSDNYICNTTEIDESVMHSLLSVYKSIIKSKHEFYYSTDSPEDLNKLIDFLRQNKVLFSALPAKKTHSKICSLT
ncbi:MAG: hypothetical protein R3A12_17495 [Ignavibacteria bacterium]